MDTRECTPAELVQHFHIYVPYQLATQKFFQSSHKTPPSRDQTLSRLKALNDARQRYLEACKELGFYVEPNEKPRKIIGTS